jgi:radical SAM protein with 4Fe4S-binding SPASM domain
MFIRSKPREWAGSSSLNKFKKIYIEITNRCNLTCSFCQPSQRPKACMGLPAFEEILRKISGHTGYISLHVLGEALLHPELESFLARSRTYGLQVNLATNGVMLAEKQVMLLQQPVLRQLNISLHSFERAGQDAALDAYLAGIFAFLDAARPASPLFINLRMWGLQTLPTPEEQRINRQIRTRLADHFGLPAPIPDDLSPGRSLTLAPRVFLSREPRFIWPHGPAPDLGGHGHCRGLRDHIAILVDGTVVPCCLDSEGDIPLGNIFQTSLPDILAGPRSTTIREGFARQQVVEPMCRRCTYRQRFQPKPTPEPTELRPGDRP